MKSTESFCKVIRRVPWIGTGNLPNTSQKEFCVLEPIVKGIMWVSGAVIFKNKFKEFILCRP
jgi:hypothetical protein